MALKLKTHFVNSIPIVSINGDLTSQEIPPVCAELVKYIKSSAKGIAVDLSGTGFMDSQGLGIIIYCSQMYKKASKQFFIIKPREFLRTIMKDLSCDQIFKIVDSEEQVLVGPNHLSVILPFKRTTQAIVKTGILSSLVGHVPGSNWRKLPKWQTLVGTVICLIILISLITLKYQTRRLQ